MLRSIPVRTLTPVIVLALWGTGLFLQPYSTHSRRDYQQQARLLFRAALEHDSVVLRNAASPAVVATLLRATDTSPRLVRTWSRNAHPYDDVQVGDTTFVWFRVPGTACSKRPLMMGFIRSAAELRATSLFNTCGV